ncbi:MAG: ABC transporter ATP-binding protein [Actinomycetota bacterium]
MEAETGSVELIDVLKRFGTVIAVDALNIQVRPGEFLSLLGPSGCGKTTTLRMLAGFEEPDEGQIRISGNAVQGVPPHKRDVNTVFQNYALFPHMSVSENVAYGLRQKKVEKGEIGRRVGEALEMVKMSKLANRKPREMSGGQQQRVALARALVNRPSLLLLDEPLGALDRKLREEMQIELKLLQSQVGITFIFVTHDQDEALSMSDRIAVMLDGRIEQLADPDTIYDHPATAFVAGFIGKQNFFEGTSRDAGRTVQGDGWTFRSTLEPVGVMDGGAALAAVRPEAILVSSEQPSEGQNAISGTLASVSHLGDVIQFVVLTPGRKELIARLPRPRAPRLEVGGQVWCAWDPELTHMFGAEQAEIVLVDPAAEGAAVAAE